MCGSGAGMRFRREGEAVGDVAPSRITGQGCSWGEAGQGLPLKACPRCAGLGWDWVNFPPSGCTGAGLGLCWNRVSNTGCLVIAAQGLHRAKGCAPPPASRQGGHKELGGTQLEQLIPTDPAISKTMWRHTQHMKLREGGGKGTFGSMLSSQVTVTCEPWAWLNPHLRPRL